MNFKNILHVYKFSNEFSLNRTRVRALCLARTVPSKALWGKLLGFESLHYKNLLIFLVFLLITVLVGSQTLVPVPCNLQNKVQTLPSNDLGNQHNNWIFNLCKITWFLCKGKGSILKFFFYFLKFIYLFLVIPPPWGSTSRLWDQEACSSNGASQVPRQFCNAWGMPFIAQHTESVRFLSCKEDKSNVALLRRNEVD